MNANYYRIHQDEEFSSQGNLKIFKNLDELFNVPERLQKIASTVTRENIYKINLDKEILIVFDKLGLEEVIM